MKKILVTGFEPFGGEKINPAWEAVKALPETIGDAQVIKLHVPVEFGVGAQKVIDVLEAERPEIVLCVGQAGGRSKITPEFVGINWAHARIPDNAGKQPFSQRIIDGAPDAYFATLPVNAMVAAMKQAEIPAAVSYTAGTYVCNDVMYQVLHALATRFPETRGTFLHVPFATEQVTEKNAAAAEKSAEGEKNAAGEKGSAGEKGTADEKFRPVPSMPLEMMTRGLQVALETALANDVDLADSESGTTC
ncbi:MAG: pyroglutamyl-peptidase I [Atopobium sp.]|nr:pyroglutamyl-peptidase I [Atopobium sp.]